MDAEDGFARDEWWQDLYEKYRKQPMNKQEWQYANHPRESVSWVQAMAFCNWLTAKYRAAGLILAEQAIRLPTEYEWEVAARYPDGRKYPWGDEYIVGHANIDESQIGGTYLAQTTAVGIYPQGIQPALDVYDFAGNLWEWTLTEWETGGNDISTNVPRVRRGGSWDFSDRIARCASRFRYDPDFRNGNLGLRVVLAVPS